MIDLHPTTCNICGGKVIYTSNTAVYGRRYGSGMCYLCTKCGAYVGTHEPRPKEALGILSNKEMRSMKMTCHNLFDALWKGKPSKGSGRSPRRKAYRWLSDQLGIPEEECHFGYFDMNMLQRAYSLLRKEPVYERGQEN